jgi:MoxR-like ATPase
MQWWSLLPPCRLVETDDSAEIGQKYIVLMIGHYQPICIITTTTRAAMQTTVKQATIAEVIAAANQVILGKETQIRLALACLLARGHLLIEDLPGVGKTTLAHTLARLMGLQFSRIQFTSDMLPADVIGISIFDRERSDFRFLPGALFSQVLLADEINRATPKTQSALLEAMEERQVTTDGQTRALPEPFFVIATQNPSSQIGTFPLPESQLDRFLMRLELGYPDHQAERALLEGGGRREQLPTLAACFTPDQLVPLQKRAAAVHVSPALLDYVQSLIEATRNSPQFIHGLSPRAALALLAAARAWAFIDGRTMVLPEDVQAVLPGVAGHRLRLVNSASHAGSEDIAKLIHAIPVL